MLFGLFEQHDIRSCVVLNQVIRISRLPRSKSRIRITVQKSAFGHRNFVIFFKIPMHRTNVSVFKKGSFWKPRIEETICLCFWCNSFLNPITYVNLVAKCFRLSRRVCYLALASSPLFRLRLLYRCAKTKIHLPARCLHYNWIGYIMSCICWINLYMYIEAVWKNWFLLVCDICV